ncbi:MAG: 4-hydroxy-2-oxo-heptane,7-dioate aldolase, partial [Planctomycetota bacterium]
IGPADLSILYGIPGQIDHPTMQQAFTRVAAAAKASGKHWGLPVGSVEQARRMLDMGARFLAHGCDIIHVKQGLERVQAEFSGLGFQFQKRLG